MISRYGLALVMNQSVTSVTLIDDSYCHYLIISHLTIANAVIFLLTFTNR